MRRDQQILEDKRAKRTAEIVNAHFELSRQLDDTEIAQKVEEKKAEEKGLTEKGQKAMRKTLQRYQKAARHFSAMAKRKRLVRNQIAVYFYYFTFKMNGKAGHRNL